MWNAKKCWKVLYCFFFYMCGLIFSRQKEKNFGRRGKPFPARALRFVSFINLSTDYLNAVWMLPSRWSFRAF